MSECRSPIYAVDVAGDEELARYGRELEVAKLLDDELNLAETEVGRDVMAAAEVHLRVRGILLADASEAELASALQAVAA